MTVLVFTALVWKVVDFIRMLFNFKNQKSGILTQVSAWIGGIILVIVASNASVTKDLILPGANQTLNTLDFASQILLGLLISSVASASVDIKQAIDCTDTAAKPPMSFSSNGLTNENQGSV